MIFALVDCNNFYASCERAFDPKLEGKPIIVLSNNDGCVIARSNEAKTLGIKMGDPFFKCKEFCKKNKIYVFSSNYELYGDMSARVMKLLEESCPGIEIYSIDEAFLSFTSFDNFDLIDYTTKVRAHVKACTGIPVSIGIGPTKTLSKIANFIAKKQTIQGIFSLCDVKVREEVLIKFPVEDIWGIGRRISAKLKKLGINFAAELKNSDPKMMRREFSVVLEKIISELNGISCIPLEEVPPSKKQIVSSRSFGKSITTISELEEAISSYAARACLKLRKQGSVASGVNVFLETNIFREDLKQYRNSINYPLVNPTSDSRIITAVSKICLRKIFREGYEYKKTGLMLFDLIPEHVAQLDLLHPSNGEERKKFMAVMDEINEKFGKRSVFLCAEGTNHKWGMRRERMSKCYTTQLSDIINVQCI